MRLWIVSFSLGVLVGGFIPFLPDFSVTLLFWLPLLLARWCRYLSLAAAFCLGVWWLLWQGSIHQRNILPAELEQQDLWASGTVTGLPQESASSTRLVFIAESLCTGADRQSCVMSPQQSGKKLLLNDYDSRRYLPGEHWLLQVRLKRPHGFANPGGFDYERWLFEENIAATGYVRDALRGNTVPSWGSGFDRLRLGFRNLLRELPLESPGFIAALTIGDRFGISDRQWQLLTQTGTNHLMVISGLHIGLVAWLVYHGAAVVFRGWPALGLMLPVSRLAAGTAMLAAFCYSGLAGFSLPVQRALVMVCCLMSGHLLVRQTAPFNNLCLALLLVLLLDPLAPQSAGFWLSFTAVALLLMTLMPRIDGGSGTVFSRIGNLVRTQYVLFLGLAPVMLLLFGQVSLLAPLVNLIAIPYIGLIVVPLCLLALLVTLVAPGFAVTVVGIPDFLLAGYAHVLAALTQQLKVLLVQFPVLPAWLLLLVALVLSAHIFIRKFHTLVIALAVLLVGYHWQPQRPHHGEFILDVLDVGQGLATVVTTREHLLVYDTGPAYSPRFNAGSGIVQPFLRRMNLGVPDTLIVSHSDNDHAGGLAALQEFYPVSVYLAGDRQERNDPTLQACRAGQSWRWDGVVFTMLHPEDGNGSGNNASCVLKIEAGRYSVLLPGDIELESELSLVRRYRDTLQATILVAPHHGSGTSSTPPFVRRVNPQHVVMTAGYLNRFNHPQPAVLARYQRQGSEIHHTAHSGTVRFQISAQRGIEYVEHYRKSRPRFWSAGQ